MHRYIRALLISTLVSAGLTVSANAVESDTAYTISSDSSSVILRTFAGGWVTIDALNSSQQFYALSGTICTPGGRLEALAVELEIVADSLRVLGDVSDMIRRESLSATRDVAMETSRYPMVRFTSTNVVLDDEEDGRQRVRVTGNLNLHGVIREETLTGHVSRSGNALILTGTINITHSAYGMQRKTVLGGMAGVKDEIELQVSLFGVR